MRNIPVIALVGGPMAGKSSVMAALKEEFGSQVVLVPEMATMLLGAGYPGPQTMPLTLWLKQFQPMVMNNQRWFEDGALLAAQQSEAKVLVTDRGLLDAAVYLPGGISEAETLFRTMGLTLDEVVKRYRQVIHLESLATAAPEKFGKTGNQVRYESLKDAQDLEYRTRRVWQQHPHWSFVPGDRGLDYVIYKAKSIISSYLNQETELKFLLPSTPRITLPKGVSITQGYLYVQNFEIRLRKMDDINYLGIKGYRPERICWDEPVPELIFDMLWPEIEGEAITKIRYRIPYEGHKLELDVFEGRLHGLVMLECKFADRESANDFQLPDWAANAFEVTHDIRYRNVNLSLEGMPKR